MNNSQGQPQMTPQQEFVEFLFYFHEISGGHCPIVTQTDGGFHVEDDPSQITIKNMQKWLDIIPNEIMTDAENENLIERKDCSKHSQWNNSYIISLTQQGMDKFLSPSENYNVFGIPSFIPDESWRDSPKGNEDNIVFNEGKHLLELIQIFDKCHMDNDGQGCTRHAGYASITLSNLLMDKAKDKNLGKKVSTLEVWMRESCPMSTISHKDPEWHSQHLARLDFKNILITDLNKWLNQKICSNETIWDIIKTIRNISAHSEYNVNPKKIKIRNQVDAVKLLNSPKDVPSTTNCIIIGIARYILWWLWRIRVAKSQEPHFSSLVQTYQP